MITPNSSGPPSFFLMICFYIQHFAETVTFSETCNAASLESSRGVSAGICRSMKIRIRPPVSPVDLRLVEVRLTFKGRNIPFVNNIKYRGIISDRKITKRIYIKAIPARAFRTFIRIYPFFKTELLSVYIKLSLHKVLIGYIMPHALPASDFVANNHLLKLQRL
jgi:hypothetical protein